MQEEEFEERIHSVYQVVSPLNQVYIGQTSVGKDRWKDYYSVTCKSQPKLYDSLKEHGSKNHRFKMLFENLTLKEADDKEIELVALYKKLKISLNIRDGGKYGTNQILGHIVNKFDLQGNFICSYPSIRKAARENKLKASGIFENLKGISNRTGDFIFSRELTCCKFISKRNKKVYQFSTSGELINEFDSTVEASHILNIPIVSIAGGLSGKNNLAYGFMFSSTPEFKGYKGKTHRTIYQYDPDLNFIQSFQTIKEVCEKLNISSEKAWYKLLKKSTKCKNVKEHNFILTFTKLHQN